MYKVRETVLSICGVLVTLFTPSSAHAQNSYSIGTGEATGVYYPVGEAIATIVNDSEADIELVVESTQGSVFNINALTSGEIGLAIAQADVVYQTFFSNEASLAERELRSIMGLYPEPLHLVCSAEAQVSRFQDIRGKRINIGNPGSGQLNIVRDLLELYDIDEDDFEAQYLEPSEASDSLSTGRSDCFFYTVGIGSAAIQDISDNFDVEIVSLIDPILDELIQKFPYYNYVTLPAGTYRGQDTELTLLGVKALLVTDTNLRDDIVYKIVTEIVNNFDQFKQAHPALENLSIPESIEGLGAPLHPGAARAYEDAGFSVEIYNEVTPNNVVEPNDEAERTDE